MELAAVMGEAFDCAELLAVCQYPDNTVLAALDAGAETGIIDQAADADGCFQFPHAIARQVLLDRLSPSRAGHGHCRIAYKLESRFLTAERRVQRLAHPLCQRPGSGLCRAGPGAGGGVGRRQPGPGGCRQPDDVPPRLPRFRRSGTTCGCRWPAICWPPIFSHAREISEQVTTVGSPRQGVQPRSWNSENASLRPGRRRTAPRGPSTQHSAAKFHATPPTLCTPRYRPAWEGRSRSPATAARLRRSATRP